MSKVLAQLVGRIREKQRKPADRRSYLRGWEHRKEADEAVVVNLDPHEVALWEKIKARFKGEPEARLRAFREYVSKHPGEIFGAIEFESAKTLAKKLHEKGQWVGVEVPCAPPWRYRNKETCRIRGERGER